MGPPTSSSLAEKKRLCSLLLSAAGARFPTLAADWEQPPLDSAALLKIGGQFRCSISIKQPERTFSSGDARGRHLHWPGT